jgi:hypothetical protein
VRSQQPNKTAVQINASRSAVESPSTADNQSGAGSASARVIE